MILASLYREVGFEDVSEAEIPTAGRHFDKAILNRTKTSTVPHVANETWRTVLHGILESPKQPKQSSKRFLQLCPLVPDCALYSGSARLAGNPWDPGALVKKVIQLGASSTSQADEVWRRLYEALSVTEKDDVWARWLEEEFAARRLANMPHTWKASPLPAIPEPIPEGERLTLLYPAKQFVADLSAIIDAKPSVTRRQWLSLLDAILRIGTTAHVLWLCSVNKRLWRVLVSILRDGEGVVPASEDEVRDQILSSDTSYLSYGNAAMATIREYASGYLLARLGINWILWSLDELSENSRTLSSAASILSLISAVKKNKKQLASPEALNLLYRMQDEEAKTIACKKGIGSNMVEFARHALGQRETANDALRGYDQSYFLKRRGDARNSPWILSVGPVAVLAVVHCCLREVSGPRSVRRLVSHLGAYGVEVDVDDINSSDLGRSLRMLGLVLDSPDAESGMLLVPPFGIGLAKAAVR